MLNLLSKVSGVDRGIGVITSLGSLSDLFLQLHYCSTFLAVKKRVLIISSHLAEWNYKTIFNKLAVRWDPSLITVVEIDDVLGNDLSISEEDIVKSLDKIFDTHGSPSLLIIDDVSTLERLGMRPCSIICLIYKLYSRLESDGLLLAPFSVRTRSFSMLISKADFVIELTPVGSGFDKDATGQMVVSVHGARTTAETSEFLYVEGDRSMKCYYPGTRSFLNV